LWKLKLPIDLGCQIEIKVKFEKKLVILIINFNGITSFLMPILIINFFMNEVTMDQLILFRKTNKELMNKMVVDLIPQTKHPIPCFLFELFGVFFLLA